MKVKQTGYCESEDTTRYFIYDETAEKKLEPPPKLFNIPAHMQADVEKTFHELGESLEGTAYGKPKLCYFAIIGTDRIEYEFDNDYAYSQEELDLIQSKAKAARNRLKKKREAEADGKQPTLFDLE